jgi:hypothetical protein
VASARERARSQRGGGATSRDARGGASIRRSSGEGGAATSAGTVTGTIFQEVKPTLKSAAPGMPAVGVRRWLLVLESGTVAEGTVLVGGSYTFRVVAPDAEPIDVWEVVRS